MESDSLAKGPNNSTSNVNSTGKINVGRGTPSPPINTSALVDANSPTYWSYSVLGRRLLFRPIYNTGYRDAEDYYQRSYDSTAGFRVAVALGGLMLFICMLALNNRYGFFRKRRKLNVSLGNSQEQLEGVEWLRLVGFPAQTSSLIYNPACSDQDLIKSSSSILYRGNFATPVLDDVVGDEEQQGLDASSRLAVSVEAIVTVQAALHASSEMRCSRSNSF